MTGSWKEKTEKEVEILPFPRQGAIMVLASTGLAQESPFNDPCLPTNNPPFPQIFRESLNL